MGKGKGGGKGSARAQKSSSVHGCLLGLCVKNRVLHLHTLPQSLLKKIHISNLRFYATAYNLFCLTNYSGFDPEVSTMRRTNLTPGVDYSAYPKSRQWVIGVNINF